MSEQIQVELQDTFGSDRIIASSAWTSSTTKEGQKKRTDEDVKRVIKMLADSKHSVPFESVIFRFWLKIPIAIDRQVEKHRNASQNGLSGRYRTMPNEYLDIAEDVIDIINKFSCYNQNREEMDLFQEYYNICEHANTIYKMATDEARNAEKSKLLTNKEFKRFREFYRGILPQHNMTEKVITLNLRSFANFIKLRDSEHAQPEIQQVAKLMLRQVKGINVCPIAIECLEANNWEI